MKRASPQDAGDAHRQRPRRLTLSSERETFWALYFASLTPLEWLRFLYIRAGVRNNNVIAAGVSLSLARLTLHHQGSTVQRRYTRAETPALYGELAAEYRRRTAQQVVRQAAQLQRQNAVPRRRLVVVASTRDRSGTVVRYDGGFAALLAARDEAGFLDLPPVVRYEALDARRVDLLRQRLDWTRARIKQRYQELGLLKPWFTLALQALLQLCSDIAAVLFEEPCDF